jgi:hypothetical protein
MGTAAQRVHRCNKRYYINETMREELEIIRSFIDPVCEVALETPIGHMVLRDPIGDGFSDSCLYGYGAGGYCVRLKIWWHLIWPPEIFLATTKFKDGSDAITINDLEFFGVIVEFSACLVAIEQDGLGEDPTPVILLWADNTSAVIWVNKFCLKSMVGCPSSLLVDSPLGINAKWIAGIDNTIADVISRLKEEFVWTPMAILTSIIRPYHRGFHS